jgi:hypothetical protein
MNLPTGFSAYGIAASTWRGSQTLAYPVASHLHLQFQGLTGIASTAQGLRQQFRGWYSVSRQLQPRLARNALCCV